MDTFLNLAREQPRLLATRPQHWAKVIWTMRSPWERGWVPRSYVIALAVVRLGLWYATLVALGAVLVAILAIPLHTLVLVGIADPTLSPPVWAAIVLGPATLGCGLYLAGTRPANVVPALFCALAIWAALTVVLISTLPNLAELVTFAGPTTQSTRTMRFEWAYKMHSKGAPSYYVTVNPFHCADCSAPSIRVSEALYDEAQTTMVDAPPSPLFPEYHLKRYTQCVTLRVERAGLAERAWLPHAGALDTTDTRECPPGVE
jgi:hypothetical protein